LREAVTIVSRPIGFDLGRGPQAEPAEAACRRPMFASSSGHRAPSSINRELTMAKMRAMVVHKAGGPLVAEERDIPVPAAEEIRLRVQACGVCHSDALTIEGGMPIRYPRVPGHEVIGVVDALGSGVKGWSAGARRRRLVRRLLRLLRPLPARQRLRLRECP
jgi:Alcohol dehydrogenase GroES-like domain